MESRNTTSASKSENDSSMFLTLMLQQLQNQDPTAPTDNTQWLSQLAQYSSLEQMTQMNSGLTKCMDYISTIYDGMSANSEITQTLSLIGKVKIGEKYYPITNIVTVKDSTINNTQTTNI